MGIIHNAPFSLAALNEPFSPSVRSVSFTADRRLPRYNVQASAATQLDLFLAYAPKIDNYKKPANAAFSAYKPINYII
jgi:hypothetical protein